MRRGCASCAERTAGSRKAARRPLNTVVYRHGERLAVPLNTAHALRQVIMTCGAKTHNHIIKKFASCETLASTEFVDDVHVTSSVCETSGYMQGPAPEKKFRTNIPKVVTLT